MGQREWVKRAVGCIRVVLQKLGQVLPPEPVPDAKLSAPCPAVPQQNLVVHHLPLQPVIETQQNRLEQHPRRFTTAVRKNTRANRNHVHRNKPRCGKERRDTADQRWNKIVKMNCGDKGRNRVGGRWCTHPHRQAKHELW